MRFKGRPISDLDEQGLTEAEDWIIEQIEEAHTHYALLTLGYQEIAEARAKLDRQALNLMAYQRSAEAQAYRHLYAKARWKGPHGRRAPTAPASAPMRGVPESRQDHSRHGSRPHHPT